MKLLLLGLLLALPLGQLTRLEFNGLAVYAHDFFLAFIFLTLLKNFSLKIFRLPFIKPLIIFCLTLLLSLIFALPTKILTNQLNEWLIGSLYFFRLLLLIGLYPALLLSFKTKKEQSWLTLLLLISGLAVLFLGFAQYLLLPDTRFLYYLGWDDHYYRLIGTFFDPNFTGIFLVLLFFFFYQEQIISTTIKRFILALNVLGLLLTFSRSSYLAWLISLLVLFAKQKFDSGRSLLMIVSNKKLIPPLLAVTAILIVFLILPKPGGEGVNLLRTYSFNQRLETIHQALIIAQKNPLFGVGFNLLRFAKRDFGFAPDWQISHSAAGIDNSFLFILATSGLIGLSTLLFVCFKILLFALKRKPFLLAASIALIIHAQFNNSLFYPFILIWYLSLLALQVSDYSK